MNEWVNAAVHEKQHGAGSVVLLDPRLKELTLQGRGGIK